MGFTPMLLGVLQSKYCCVPSSREGEYAGKPTAVLEATGLRIQSIASGGTSRKWLEGFGNTSLRCQPLGRFIFRR